jgi:hypothetical protein
VFATSTSHSYKKLGFLSAPSFLSIRPFRPAYKFNTSRIPRMLKQERLSDCCSPQVAITGWDALAIRV